MKTKLIKIFDKRIANALSEGGFSYTQETVNGDQIIYCYLKTPELVKAIHCLCEKKNYQEAIIIVQDNLLFF